ncbi:MAG: phosphatidate cytidylyltransferase [Evtepia sp.]|uniref:phosphatidate cytidylyltransferase n=1 Tax=Evtepia sp. TaxID=2773933 RepID=UPI002A74E038|nr:phosphatidate cytidylyltransferase [Evtepia sp.]MDY3014591.1 phosphatidate cytidylyltransferase [Evtepia sp.]
MKSRILVACVGIPLILVVLFALPEAFTPALVAVLSAVGTYEALHAIGMNHPRIALYTAALAVLIPFWVYYGEDHTWALLGLMIYLVLIFAEAFASHFRVKIDRVGAGFFFALVISYCLSSVVRIGALELRTSYIFLPFVLPFVVDAAAMITGMFLGKRKMTPNLSPKKTVEGAIGGLIAGVVICILYGIAFRFITKVEVNYYFLAVYGILGGVITEMGDLAFSYIKRTRKVKDFGHIFPGHGGVLDRFDSVIFCAPLLQLLITWLPAFK